MPDYSKFDKLAAACGDSDDDDDDLSTSKPSQKKAANLAPGTAAHSKALHGSETMFKIVGWLGEAAPWLSDTETTRLVRFVATSDRTMEPDLVKLYEGLATFMRTEGDVIKPDKRALVAVCHHAEQQRQAAEDKEDAATCGRVLMAAMGALNALGVFDDEGGADKVVAQLKAEPKGELAKIINDYEYAKYSIQYETIDGSQSEQAKRDERQAKALAKFEKKARGEEGGDDDDAPLPPLPRKVHPLNKPAEPRTMSQYVMRSAIVHIGTVCAAILVREIMKEYFPDQVVGLKTWWVSVFGSRD